MNATRWLENMSDLDGIDHNKLLMELAQDEGVRSSPYRDSMGNWTIGIGHYIGNSSSLAKFKQLHTIPMTVPGVLALWANDLGTVFHALNVNAFWWSDIDPVRRRVLLNMCFNLGWGDGSHGLSTFKTFLTLVEHNAFGAAADDMLRTAWAHQVGDRAVRLSVMMRTGLDATGEVMASVFQGAHHGYAYTLSGLH